MDSFKLKIKTIQVEFDFEVEKPEKEDMELIKEIVRMLDRKTATPLEKMDREELREKYKDAAKGYQLFANDIKGFHNGIDEYLVQEVVEEIKSEKDIQEEPVSDIIAIKEQKTEEYNIESKKDRNEEHTSIRYNSYNEELYQTYYVCPKCRHKGKRYIPKHAFQTVCHNCYNQMRIKPASLEGFPNIDKYGNIFVAGDFKPTEESQPQFS